jgi:hypothetical protein
MTGSSWRRFGKVGGDRVQSIDEILELDSM